MDQGASSKGTFTGRLLQEVAQRPITNIKQDVNSQDTFVDDPWLINSAYQVEEYAKRHPNKFLAMLHTLRYERDSLATTTQWYMDLRYQAETTNNRFEAMKVQGEALQAAKVVVDRELVTAKKGEAEWKKKYDDLLDDQANFGSATPNQSRRKLTPKFPDPPVFTDGVDPTWDDWVAKIAEKLETNEDHYPTEKSRVNYVISRIGGEAVTYTIERRRRGTTNPYQDIEELLDQLAEVYEDTDRVKNAQREYNNLQMGSQPFKSFIADLMRLGHICGFTDNHLMNDLEGKIPKRLKDRITGVKGGFTDLRDLKNFLIGVDNTDRSDFQQRMVVRKKADTTATPVPNTSSKRTYPNPVARAPLSTATPLATVPDLKGLVTDSNCFGCGKPGHLGRNCPEPESVKKAYRESKIARVHEINIDDEYELKHKPDHEYSSDSGNE